MRTHTIIAGYDATEEAADGLRLARLLGSLTGAPVLVARVLRDGMEQPVHDRDIERRVRRAVQTTRAAVLAVIPDAHLELIPVFDASLARGLHDVAETEGAGFIVLGATHHGALGRAVLGG